jgi:tetratricopeptide (TPR) repeat protein
MGGIRAPLGLGIAALRSRFGGVADFVNRHACGRGITTALAVLLVGAGCVFGQSWKNQGEFDLYTAITKEADAHKKLELLDQWRAKYPESEFQRNRLSFYINVYQQLKDNRKIVETLEEIEALAPKDDEVKKGLMLFILECNNPDPFFLASGERAAASLIGGPLEGLAHTMLGWVAMNRKDAGEAEREFRLSLKSDPNAAQVDIWLGNLLRARKTPEGMSQALFFYARVASIDGPARAEYEKFVRKVYDGYHGADEAGFSALTAMAKESAFPPEGFLIPSAAAIAEEKQKEFESAHPQLALWTKLKAALTAPNGAAYFESSMKGAEVPGGAGGVQCFKAIVIAARLKELTVGISDRKTAEVVLKLDGPLAVRPAPGTEIEFSGVPEAFTSDPFLVTFAARRAEIKGLKTH